MQAVIFIHGMGVIDPNWMEKYTKIFCNIYPCKPLAVSYGEIVKDTPLTTLARSRQPASEDTNRYSGEELDEQFALGFGFAQFKVEGVEGLMPTGKSAKSVAQDGYNTYSYAIRYLARRKVHESVINEVFKQMNDHLKARTEKSVVLIAHSLGTVVALDILANAKFQNYIGKCITLGSPLGVISLIPVLNKKFLPPRVRVVKVPWVDIATEGDIVSTERIKKTNGFDGTPFTQDTIEGSFKKPHGAYFFEQEAVEYWVNRHLLSEHRVQ